MSAPSVNVINEESTSPCLAQVLHSVDVEHCPYTECNSSIQDVVETINIKDVGTTVSEFLLFGQSHFGCFFYLWPDINQEQPWTKLGYLGSYSDALLA